MAWRKIGNIFTPNRQQNWIHSHASQPVAQHLADQVYRIFFSARDAQNRSHIGYLNYDLGHQKVLEISRHPVLSPGPKGAFDMNGVSMGCVLPNDNKWHLFYTGWGAFEGKQFNNTIGQATWDEAQGRFIKSSPDPIIGLDEHDKFNLSYPFVLKQNNDLLLWYGSNLHWGNDQRIMHHHLKLARSANGTDWLKEGVVLDLERPEEVAVLKPSVILENGLYKMWYSYKTSQYAIGYAESTDGYQWQRQDQLAGISTSSSGWDDTAVAYPHVFFANGQKYLLYNGNQYGKTGFGLAVWE
jgi:hypothetical protein